MDKRIIIAAVVAVLIGGGALVFRQDGKPSGGEQIFCTQEAKLCPDGSYVGRSGPNCEFAPCPDTTPIKLYYYYQNLDKDASGNIQCSRQGLIAADRTLPRTQTPIQDAVKLLLRGEISSSESARGISTEFPLPGVSLAAASLRDGVLTLTFDDPQNRTSGGACRAGILWFQIEATTKQFPGVQSVRFAPEYLFQP